MASRTWKGAGASGNDMSILDISDIDEVQALQVCWVIMSAPRLMGCSRSPDFEVRTSKFEVSSHEVSVHASSVRRLCLISVCFLAILPARGFAQGAAPPPPPPPPKHEATGEIAFVGTTGNASTSAFAVSGEDITRPTNWTIRNRVIFLRNESESTLTAKSFFYGFRGERVINKKLSAFGEYGYFQDRFAGVEHRNSVNGGLSFKLIETDRQQLSVDGLLGYLNEQRVTGDDISTGTYGFGGNYKLKISPTATIEEDARYIGTFARAEDWRLVQAFSVTAQMTSLLSLKFSNVVRYNNFPAQTFKKTDTTTSVELVAKFKRQ